MTEIEDVPIESQVRDFVYEAVLNEHGDYNEDTKKTIRIALRTLFENFEISRKVEDHGKSTDGR